jgi:hypothetical protein
MLLIARLSERENRLGPVGGDVLLSALVDRPNQIGLRKRRPPLCFDKSAN